jgi:hypothetical protein
MAEWTQSVRANAPAEGDIGDPAMNEDLESKRRIILRKYLDGLGTVI